MSKGKQAESVYISAGCNRYSNVADVRKDGLVIYGAGKLVCLWDSEDPSCRGVHRTLCGNEGTVTTIKFLPTTPDLPSSSFVSGDTSGKVIIWRENGKGSFTKAATLVLGSPVGSLAALQTGQSSHLLAVGTSGGHISLFQLEEQVAPKALKKLNLKGKMPMDIGLTYLPNSKAIVMSVGGTDSKIQLYTKAPNAETFSYATSLPGHADWVRCLAFSAPLDAEACSGSSEHKEGDLLLASGSQDNYIRLWRFTTTRQSGSTSALAAGKSALDMLDELDENADEIAAKQYTFAVEGEDDLFAVTSESVLLGHDGWITGIHWQSDNTGLPHLLSASADRSMILWSQDTQSSLWLTTHRFGEIGGTNLGFFGALFGKDSDTVLAHGWGGSFHSWRKTEDTQGWRPMISVTGHFDDVTSLAWEPEGEYLISVSVDQTARLHAPWTRDKVTTWHELGRPQLHGYDMDDAAFLSRTRFISGSEEKIVRVFDAPNVFIASMKSLGTSETLANDGVRPNAATVPALGLSNRAVFDTTAQSELNGTANGTSETVSFQALSQPPFEEQLLTTTLWPETEKLYGHGYEINAIAASHDGQLVASACRSTTAEHAVIRLHNTENWAQILPPLRGHTLTVTAIRFSPDDRYILTTSRDRSWQLYERQEGYNYVRVAQTAKAHARIIWDCCWSTDGGFFATASRDKQVKIWQKAGEDATRWTCVSTLALQDAATAVSFTQCDEGHLLAVGTEAGHIVLYSSSAGQESTWSERLTLLSEDAHCATVRTLAWQPVQTLKPGPIRLASCSDDRSVRVLDIQL